MSALRRAWAMLAGIPAGALTDAIVLAYAAWTITANLVVIAGGNAHHLLRASAACAALVALGTFWFVRSARLREAYLADLRAEPEARASGRIPLGGRAALGFGATALASWMLLHDAWLAWGSLVLAALALVWAALRPEEEPPPHDEPWLSPNAELIATYVTAAVAAVVTLLVVRPRSDGTFYLNMAVSLVDFPEQALLSIKNVHGPASATLPPQPMFPPYRVHSFEVLGGLLARLTGLSAAQVIHFGLAPMFAWLTPFALRRLLRIVAPRQVALLLALVVAFHFIEGSAARGYANHAFVRMFDGKAVLLTVLLPLVCAYGLRFGARPSGFRFLMLAVAQIAGVGASSTGIWLLPTAALLSVVAATPSLRMLPGRAAVGVASSAYVLGLGLWIMGQLQVGGAEPTEIDDVSEGLAAMQSAAVVPRKFALIAEAFSIVLGPAHTAVGLLGALLVGAALAPTTLARRWIALLILALVVGFANPLLAKLIATLVTGPVTYHRVLWLAPVPLALAFAASGLLRRLRTRFAPPVATVLTAAALLAFFVGTVDRLVISRLNEASIKFPPTLKLPPTGLALARELCKWAPTGTHVLAPMSVSQQLPTLHGCGAPLIAAARWMNAPKLESETRLAMLPPIDKGRDVPVQYLHWYAEQLARHDIDVVLIAKEAARNSRVKSIVRMQGLERVAAHEWHQIYARERATSVAQSELLARMVCRLGGQGAVLAPFSVARALDARKCMTNVASPSATAALPPARAEEILKLERVASMGGDSTDGQAQWLRSALSSRNVSMVVLAPSAIENKAARAVIEDVGLRRLRIYQGHTFFARTDDAPVVLQ